MNIFPSPDSQVLVGWLPACLVAGFGALLLLAELVRACTTIARAAKKTIDWLKRHKGALKLVGHVLEAVGRGIVTSYRAIMASTGANRSVARRITLFFVTYSLLAAVLGCTIGPELAASLAPPWIRDPRPDPTAPPAQFVDATPHSTTAPESELEFTPFHMTMRLSATIVQVGQPLTIVAETRADRDGSPITGARCSLYAPRGMNPGVLRRWPAATVSDHSGTCVWHIAAGAVAPGRYTIGVEGVAGVYSARREQSVTVAQSASRSGVATPVD